MVTWLHQLLHRLCSLHPRFPDILYYIPDILRTFEDKVKRFFGLVKEGRWKKLDGTFAICRAAVSQGESACRGALNGFKVLRGGTPPHPPNVRCTVPCLRIVS